jgi:hypothetical protein
MEGQEPPVSLGRLGQQQPYMDLAPWTRRLEHISHIDNALEMA